MNVQARRAETIFLASIKNTLANMKAYKNAVTECEKCIASTEEVVEGDDWTVMTKHEGVNAAVRPFRPYTQAYSRACTSVYFFFLLCV